jgi:osmotically-inducible protein OsmY
MLKKIIMVGLIIIAVLSAILIWGMLQDRSEPTRPDSLINKDETSLANQFVNSLTDTNETNTSMEVAPNTETTQAKPKKEDSGFFGGSNESDNSIDDNNNIYTNDKSSQQSNTVEPEEEETNEPQKIDTNLKESLSDIQSKVQKKINNSSSLSGSNIEVSTNDKGIVLSGIVTSAKQKILAGSIANSASENATVINRITVEVPKPIEAEKSKDSEAVPVVSPEKSM